MTWTNRPIFDDQRQVMEISAIGSDVTEHKLAEQALRQHRDHLDALVRERTAELESRNAQLAVEVKERKRAEELLRIKAAELEDLYNNAPCGYHSLDENGIFVLINDTELTWLGYRREEIVGIKSFADLITPESAEIFGASFPKFLEQAWISDLQFEMVRKDGSTFPVILNSVALRDEAGRYQMSRSMVFDNTERKAAEQALQKSELQFRQMAYTIEDVFWLSSPHGTASHYVSPAFQRIWGRSCAELFNSPNLWMEAIHPEDVPRVLHHLDQLFGGAIVQMEYRIRRPDGTLRWISDRGYPLLDGSGAVTLVTGVASDITVRKEAEEVQTATLELLRLCNKSKSMFELMRELMVFFQQFSGCEAVGVRLREGDDFPYYEARGFPQEFLFTEKTLCSVNGSGEVDRDATGSALLECLCGNVLCGNRDAASPHYTEQGSFWTNSCADVLEYAKGAECVVRGRYRCVQEGYQSMALIPLRIPGETFGLFQFNDRKPGRFTLERMATLERLVSYVTVALAKFKTDEKLQKSHRVLQQTQEIARIGNYLFEVPRQRWTSSAILDGIFGIDAAFDRSAAGWLELIHPAQRLEMRSYLEDVIGRHGRFNKEYRIVRPCDGEERWVHGMGEVEYDPDGAAVRMVGTIQDITERKRAEEQIYRYAGRLIEIAEDLRKRIAMQLHDDIGQEIAALGLNLNIMENFLPAGTGEALWGRLAESKGITKELVCKVRNLMADLRPVHLEEYGVPVSVRAHAEQYARRTGITVDVQADPQFPRLEPEKEMALFRSVQEALTNVAKHADAAHVLIKMHRAGDTVTITVADDGKGGGAPSGMKPSSGWGLSNMRERMDLVGGVLRVRSILGAGTTVELEIGGVT